MLDALFGLRSTSFSCGAFPASSATQRPFCCLLSPALPISFCTSAASPDKNHTGVAHCSPCAMCASSAHAAPVSHPRSRLSCAYRPRLYIGGLYAKPTTLLPPSTSSSRTHLERPDKGAPQLASNSGAHTVFSWHPPRSAQPAYIPSRTHLLEMSTTLAASHGALDSQRRTASGAHTAPLTSSTAPSSSTRVQHQSVRRSVPSRPEALPTVSVSPWTCWPTRCYAPRTRSSPSQNDRKRSATAAGTQRLSTEQGETP
ncbi:hypothetical protein GY45DRAFT_601711 [Cubamyces sp. BRFM 1775]|nr:hypothetical protein GY45DRAFT_601711 [Cubamyces sp. BRFM 1775]